MARRGARDRRHTQLAGLLARTGALIALGWGLAGGATALPMIDQQNPSVSPMSFADLGAPALAALTDGGLGIDGGDPIGQQFVPTLPTLISVDVLILDNLNPSAVPTITLNLRDDNGDGPIDGSILASVVADPIVFDSGAAIVTFDFASPLLVTPGQTYVLELMASTSRGDWANTFDDEYLAGGSIAFGMLDGFGAGTDFAFQTTGDVVPEPGTSVLLATGLGALTLARRRRSRGSSPA